MPSGNRFVRGNVQHVIIHSSDFEILQYQKKLLVYFLDGFNNTE